MKGDVQEVADAALMEEETQLSGCNILPLRTSTPDEREILAIE